MTDHTDLIARLRNYSAKVPLFGLEPDIREAADVIEAQAKEIERYQQALRRISVFPDKGELMEPWIRNMAAVARAALEGGK